MTSTMRRKAGVGYLPIEDHGVIGNLCTAALVGTDGTIDWLCLPAFDSPSVFAAILDDEKGGRFKIAPAVEGVAPKQLYWPDTNVLVTRFFAPDGVAEITDYMPVGAPANGQGRHQLVRRVRVVRGEMAFRMECSPAFNYARDGHKTEITKGGACFHSEPLSLGLATDVPLRSESNGAVSEFSLREDQTALFVLREIESGADCGLSLQAGGRRAFYADRRVLAPVALEVNLHGPLARDGSPLSSDAQAPDL